MPFGKVLIARRKTLPCLKGIEVDRDLLLIKISKANRSNKGRIARPIIFKKCTKLSAKFSRTFINVSLSVSLLPVFPH